MALYDFLTVDPGVSFDVVDILGIVCQQFALVLQKFDKSVCRGEFLLRGKYIFCNREENARVFIKQLDIKDFLRVTQPQVLQP